MLSALISRIISSSLCSAGWWCFFDTLFSHSKWRSYSFRSECSCVNVGLSFEKKQTTANITFCRGKTQLCKQKVVPQATYANSSNHYLEIVEIMGCPVAHFRQRPEPVWLHIWVEGMLPLERRNKAQGIGANSLSPGTSHGDTRKVLLCHLQWVTAFLLLQTVALRAARSIGSV